MYWASLHSSRIRDTQTNPLLVVVANHDIECVSVLEPEADSPLVVHRDRMLPLSIAAQRMKRLLGGTFRSPRLVAASNCVNLRNARLITSGEKRRDRPLKYRSRECLSEKLLITEISVSRHVTHVNQEGT